jgi:hypothetical protein
MMNWSLCKSSQWMEVCSDLIRHSSRSCRLAPCARIALRRIADAMWNSVAVIYPAFLFVGPSDEALALMESAGRKTARVSSCSSGNDHLR